MGYRIHALNAGTITVDRSLFTTMRGYGQPIQCPVVVWLIEGQGRQIVVDTGAPPPGEAPTVTVFRQTEEQRVERALAAVGVDVADVETVVLTHLHWDHCTAAPLFGKARFIVQRSELAYAAAPLPVHNRPYGGNAGVTASYLPRDGRVQIVDGDYQLCEGVRLLHLPGHSPGMQGVLVDTQRGRVLIAGDNVPLYANWEGEPGLRRIPNTLHVNLEDYERSFRRMERLADYVIAGHDPRNLSERGEDGPPGLPARG